jgi:exopolyphosphatase/guanosine-5'-triphosphate,3'-diphosphate pyrophosphatase
MTPARAARPDAVIDIGTNSIKLLVAVREGARIRPLHFRRVTTRLGAGLHAHGRIAEAAAARTARAVRALAAEARRHRAGRVVAVGTYALRAAPNGGAVARRIARASGVEVRILSGREEAHLAFLSARAHLARPRPATFLLDVGGGSAQFVAARGGRVLRARSLPLGALRLTERYLHRDPIDPEEHARMRAQIERVVNHVAAPVARLSPRADFVAVGGSATTALAMARGGRRRPWDGVVTIGALRRIERECLARTVAARRRLPGLPADRADIMPAGLAVVLAFAAATRKRKVLVAGGGVREGVILAMDD